MNQIRRLLVLVDAQNDFINGILGSEDAERTVPSIVTKIDNWEGDIIATLDSHFENYLETHEGKLLPIPHTIVKTWGHELNPDILSALSRKPEKYQVSMFLKDTFGSIALAEMIQERGYDEIELIGFDTNVCVISNAMILRAMIPEIPIYVDGQCCAGMSPELHKSALAVMETCQIEMRNGENT